MNFMNRIKKPVYLSAMPNVLVSFITATAQRKHHQVLSCRWLLEEVRSTTNSDLNLQKSQNKWSLSLSYQSLI